MLENLNWMMRCTCASQAQMNGASPSVTAKAALTHLDMDSARPLKVFSGIWLHDVSSRSFNSCNSSVDRTCLSSKSHRCSTRLRSGEFGGQVDIINPLLCSSNRSCFVAGWYSLLKLATTTWEYCTHKRVNRVCNDARVGVKLTSTWQNPSFPSRTLPKASHFLHCLM